MECSVTTVFRGPHQSSSCREEARFERFTVFWNGQICVLSGKKICSWRGTGRLEAFFSAGMPVGFSAESFMTNISTFCTCEKFDCKLHPTNHDKGCAPCIAKNLKTREIPNCMFNLVRHSETRKSDSYEEFAHLILAEAKEEHLSWSVSVRADRRLHAEAQQFLCKVCPRFWGVRNGFRGNAMLRSPIQNKSQLELRLEWSPILLRSVQPDLFRPLSWSQDRRMKCQREQQTIFSPVCYGYALSGAKVMLHYPVFHALHLPSLFFLHRQKDMMKAILINIFQNDILLSKCHDRSSRGGDWRKSEGRHMI